ncbi:MAG: SpoIIE family protein phosphatase [Spirochaetes bacterium]|nr:SpoIIE family protein phosphatase [Spirochaetota bacterium]
MIAQHITHIFDPASYSPSIYSLPTAVVSIGIFIIGLVALIRERANLLSVSFFLMTLAFAEWFFAFTFLYSCTDETVALFWAKAGYIGVPCIPASIFLFVVLGLGIYQNWKALAWFNWLLSALFSIAIITTDTLIATLYHYWWGYYPKYGWLSIPFLAYFFVIVLFCVFLAWREYIKAVPGTIFQKRIKLVGVALGIASIGVIDFVAKYGFPVYPFAYIPFTVFLILAIYILRRYRIVEITPALAADVIIDTLSDALFAVDHEGYIRMVNHAALDLFGRSQRDMIGRAAAEIVGGDLFTGDFSAVLGKGVIRNHEMEYTTLKSEIRTLSLSASPMHEIEKDPVGMLFVARDISELKQKEAELEKANRELNERQRLSELEMGLAINIQTQFLPDRPPVNNDWDITFLFKPMLGVSGDFFDFYMEDGVLKGTVVCDVSGHGVSSGLITLLAKSTMARHFTAGVHERLAPIVDDINAELIREFHSIDNYLTGILLRFTGSQIEYVNACHPDLLVKRKKTGNVFVVKPRDREIKGKLLGKDIFADPFEILNFSVEKGDSLLLLTDGLVDCYNSKKERYDFERLSDTFRRAPGKTAEEIKDYIMNDVENFIGGTPLPDDITFIVMKRLT